MSEIPLARSIAEFCAGPLLLKSDQDLSALKERDRILVIFTDCEVVMTVVGKPTGGLHLGSFLAPWSYLHWKLEPRDGGWRLTTSDDAEIARLRRFYGGRKM